MPRKNYKNQTQAAETLLATVISGLQRGGETQRRALRQLVEEGPFGIGTTGGSVEQDEALAALGADLLAFVRGLVDPLLVTPEGAPTKRAGGRPRVGEYFHMSPLHLKQSLTLYSVLRVDSNRPYFQIDADQHDTAVMQFVILLDRVGLPNVRACGAPDCDRIYVKTYRREFCSSQCQKRVYARKVRGKKRELQQRRERARRRRQIGE